MPNSLEPHPPDDDTDSALANSAVAAFYEIEAPGKHLLAKFGTKYYVGTIVVGTIVAATLGKESSGTSSTECNSTYCFLDAPLFAGAMTQEAARASPFMTDNPLLPGNFRIIFHDNDACDFSINECVMGLEAYEIQQLKRLVATDAKDERLTHGMRDFLCSVPKLSILGATTQEIKRRPVTEAGYQTSSFNRKSFSPQLKKGDEFLLNAIEGRNHYKTCALATAFQKLKDWAHVCGVGCQADRVTPWDCVPPTDRANLRWDHLNKAFREPKNRHPDWEEGMVWNHCHGHWEHPPKHLFVPITCSIIVLAQVSTAYLERAQAIFFPVK